ncbi:hypothetical protein IEQ34_015133 [Dendrobium chrysotoxum]|uniref:HMA domain-containing protein n=1 Tax=Dendrobium chrysotoxum TaxID=161865 RepID=A0AAV7GL53_DENCH|nr:hypothetical protein IEQ34_015133 [Dendrobium chrysotoxum]
MGEEAKQAEVKGAEAPKQEEKPAAEHKEEKQEEKKEEVKPSPPPPIVLFLDLHCVGCAKKIERAILKCRGVEKVEMNIEKNEVTVKGIVDPQALCSHIQKKTSRNAIVLSPLPPADTAADSTKAEPPAPQDGGIVTVELLVNMHCDACAQQLRKKIMKMRGVQAAETDLTAKKVTVTGTMNGEKLVEYIYRRTGKLATIIPLPRPPPPQEEKKNDGEKKAEDSQKPPDEKKEDGKKEETDDKKSSEGNKEEKPSSGTQEPSKKEEAVAAAVQAMINDEEMVKRMMYWNGAGGYMMNQYHDDEMSKRMMMMHHWMPMQMPMPTTMYFFDRPQLLPPPQMFSDENPNACSIS